MSKAVVIHTGRRHFLSHGRIACEFFDPKMAPKIGQKLRKNGTKNGTILGPILGPFWVDLMSVLGSVLGLEWAKMRQDGSNEDSKSLKVPRSIIFKKCDFTIGKQYLLSLGGSQEEYERFRKAPKRHLKSFKTSKERVPNMEPKSNSF